MRKGNRTFWLSILGGVLGIAFLSFGCRVPIRLSVDVKPATIYAGDKLEPKDFQVKSKTLFGFGDIVSNFEVFTEDGNERVAIQWEHLRKFVNVRPVKAKKVTAVYEGSLYVGQVPDVEKLQVQAVYEDGTQKVVESVWIDHQVVPNRKEAYSFLVHTGIQDVKTEKHDVVAPDSMSASYLGDAVVGERFYWEKVCVSLHYPDNTTFRTHEFLVHSHDNVVYTEKKQQIRDLSYPKYLNEEMDLFAITPYGTTKFHLAPKQVNALIGHYGKPVYEGDMLQEKDVSVTMQTEQYGDVPVTEYRFVNPGCVTTDMNIRIPTRFGTAWLSLTPVKVTSVYPILPNDVQEGDEVVLNGIRLVYEDGKELELHTSDVQFLNLPSTWKQKQTVWFIWHQNQYAMTVEAVSREVLEHRGEEKGVVYDASDETVKTLSLICQRLGDKDMDLNAQELGLMLNRYELYGAGRGGSGDDLLNYVLDSGYWGSRDSILSIIQNSKPNKNVLQMVQDTLYHGYRVFPTYVDERISSSVFSEYTDVILQKDTLVLQDTTGESVYLYTTDDSSGYLYGYSERAYERVHGRKPDGIVLEPNTTIDMDDAEAGIQIVMPEE